MVLLVSNEQTVFPQESFDSGDLMQTIEIVNVSYCSKRIWLCTQQHLPLNKSSRYDLN